MTFDPRSAIIFGILATLILVASAIVASAEHVPNYQGYRPTYVWSIHEWREVRRTRRNRREPLPTYREWRETDGGRCKSPVAVVGDQYATVKGAQDESDKAWAQTIRYMHGERWMSRDNADDVSYECGRSSVGSVVGQVFYRCRISARPCRPQPQNGDR
jgi:hypothetical protein